MKIRNRITLWITFAGLLSSLILSLIVFFEMLEQPYELLDQELDTNARALASTMQVRTDGSLELPVVQQNRIVSPYWIRIVDERQQNLYESNSASLVDLPLHDPGKGYTVKTDIPFSHLNTRQEDADEQMAFRVRVFSVPLGGNHFFIQIARPMEKLDEEIIDLIIILAVGLAVSVLVLLFVGYYVAGRILQPIRDINATAHEINEKTLDKRIPLGRNHDELHELSSALNSMFDRLQFSFVRQKEFIANASHELKTPITMLQLSLEEALQYDNLPVSYQKLLASQNRTLLRMNRLVKNLLDLSALELMETYSGEEFSFNELAESVIEAFQPLFQQQDIHFAVQMDEQLHLNADREKIKRMLINLVDNAVKYNQQGGEIRLQAGKENRRIVINLSNTGPGIPTQDLERVFEQFYRVDKSRSTAYGGSGLGLTIVKKITDLHGGEISLQSTVGEWTRIRIAIPIKL